MQIYEYLVHYLVQGVRLHSKVHVYLFFYSILEHFCKMLLAFVLISATALLGEESVGHAATNTIKP